MYVLTARRQNIELKFTAQPRIREPHNGRQA